TPAADCADEVVDEVPSTAPLIAASPSIENSVLARGISPFSSMYPARWLSPVRVPVASKKSTKKNVKTTESSPAPKAPAISIWKARSLGQNGAATGKPSNPGKPVKP